MNSDEREDQVETDSTQDNRENQEQQEEAADQDQQDSDHGIREAHKNENETQPAEQPRKAEATKKESLERFRIKVTDLSSMRRQISFAIFALKDG
jgi:hypothetical protein